jgi:hypothetical protein
MIFQIRLLTSKDSASIMYAARQITLTIRSISAPPATTTVTTTHSKGSHVRGFTRRSGQISGPSRLLLLADPLLHAIAAGDPRLVLDPVSPAASIALTILLQISVQGIGQLPYIEGCLPLRGQGRWSRSGARLSETDAIVPPERLCVDQRPGHPWLIRREPDGLEGTIRNAQGWLPEALAATGRKTEA